LSKAWLLLLGFSVRLEKNRVQTIHYRQGPGPVILIYVVCSEICTLGVKALVVVFGVRCWSFLQRFKLPLPFAFSRSR